MGKKQQPVFSISQSNWFEPKFYGNKEPQRTEEQERAKRLEEWRASRTEYNRRCVETLAQIGLMDIRKEEVAGKLKQIVRESLRE